MKLRSHYLLREFIKSSLKSINEMEGDVGGIPELGNYYGASYGSFRSAAEISPGGLMDTFVQPFTDVFKTAVAGAKEITTDVKTLLHVSFRAVISTFLPFIGTRYDDIFEKRDEKIKKIRDEYADVFKRTDETLGSGEAKLFAFMFNPGLFLGGAAASKAPAATKSLLSISTGGISDDILDAAKSKWKKFSDKRLAGEKYKDKDKDKYKAAFRRRQKEFWDQLADDIEGRRVSESTNYRRALILREVKEKQVSDNSKEDQEFLKQMFANPRILKIFSNMIKENKKLQTLYSEMTKVEEATLKESEELANKILKRANTLDDLQAIVNDPKAKSALDKVKKSDKKAQEALLNNIKSATKETFMAQLSARAANFPKNSPQRKMYDEALSNLKSS